MGLLKRMFESKENKVIRYLAANESILENGYNSAEIKGLRGTGMLRCNVCFELCQGKVKAEFILSDFELNSGVMQQYTKIITEKGNEKIKYSCEGREIKLDNKLLMSVLDKYQKILTEYQEDEEIKYRLFIKSLLSGQYTVKERTISSKGIEIGKELLFNTGQDNSLVLSREARSLLIKVKDINQLYLRNLEYSLKKEEFVNAMIRKLNIPNDEKESLISFIKQYIESKNVERLFTEEEILLSKINK